MSRHADHDGCLLADHAGYSRRYLDFIKSHRDAFDAAYLDGNAQASRNELERLGREYQTLPPRHSCSCWPTHCLECARLARSRVTAPSAVEIGRSKGARAYAPMPMPTMLDLNAGYV